MAFTGSATILQVSDRKVRITGLSLASAAVGTISLSGGTGAVKLPHAFKASAYVAEEHTVNLQDSIQASIIPTTAVATAIPVEIVKTGTTPTDFLISLTNNHGSLASPNLEIYIEFH
jgi:hypothetical protein